MLCCKGAFYTPCSLPSSGADTWGKDTHRYGWGTRIASWLISFCTVWPEMDALKNQIHIHLGTRKGEGAVQYLAVKVFWAVGDETLSLCEVIACFRFGMGVFNLIFIHLLSFLKICQAICWLSELLYVLEEPWSSFYFFHTIRHSVLQLWLQRSITRRFWLHLTKLTTPRFLRTRRRLELQQTLSILRTSPGSS